MKNFSKFLLLLVLLWAIPAFAQQPPLEDQFRTIAWFQPGTTGKSLNVKVQGATVLFNGANVVVPDQVILLPDNSTTFIDFEGTKNLVTSQTGFGSVNPVYYPIALVITSQGNVSQISDQRPTYTLSSSGGGGGGSPSGPPGTVQITNGNQTGFASSAILDNGTIILTTEPLTVGGNAIVNGDFQGKGPNPYTDCRAYGCRQSSNGTPAAPGVTGTINASSTSLSISGFANTLQNGDGIDVFGAGTACSLTTPTSVVVTPSVAAASTGTGIVVNALSGSTSYSYQIIAVDRNGCFTSASTAGSTSTGSSSLGSQTATITGFTQSGNTVTATTSAATGLVVGADVMIVVTNAVDGPYYAGRRVVLTTPDTTHFTFLTGNTVSNGAPTASAAGATLFYFNENHITWTSHTGDYQYYIYGRSGGSLTLIGTSLINNTAAPITSVNSWDDFGSTMEFNQFFPYWVPTTPPVSASAAGTLVTTICAGGGTTSLTLCNAAVNSVSNAMVLFDNAPTILAAANAVGQNGLLYIPGGNFPVNSHLTLPVGIAVELADSTLTLNATLEVGSGTRIFGMIGPQQFNAPAFGWPTGGVINTFHTSPGVYDNSGQDDFYYGLQINGTANAQVPMLVDGGGGNSQGHFSFVNFIDGGGANDLMGIPLYMRGGFWYDFDHVTFNSGPGQEGGGFRGSTTTPGAYFSAGGLTFNQISVQDRGIFHIPSQVGMNVKITGQNRGQGLITPFFTVYNAAGGSGALLECSIDIDTSTQSKLAFLGGISTYVVTLCPGTGSSPSGNSGFLTGQPVGQGLGFQGLVVGATLGQNSQAVSYFSFTDNAVNVTGQGEFMVPLVNNVAPGVVVSAGGNVPVGSAAYAITMLDINGNESTIGPFVNITTTTGNQTVTITPPAAPAGAVSFIVYRGPVNAPSDRINATCFTPGTFGVPVVDNLAFSCGHGNPQVNRAGSQSISAAGLSGTAINFTGGGFKNTISGVFTANRTLTISDVSGTLATLSGAFTATHCVQVNGAGTTLSLIDSGATCGAGGGGGATFQVNGTNTTNQTTINFQNSAAFNGLTATFTNPSVGNVQLGFSGTLGNAGLTNSSVTVNTAAPLTGGGALSLGGTLSLACATCSTAVVNAGTSNHIAEYTASGSPATISSDANLDDGATSPSTLTYTGAGGVVAPQLKTTGLGGGAFTAVEGSNPAGVASSDILFASSLTHRFGMNNNNGGPLVVAANPMTAAGDLVYGGSVANGVAPETRLAAGTATQVLHSGTTPAWSAVVLTTDVSGTLPVANGGCAASTAANCLINIFPTATRAGDVIYWNGSVWTNLAGNNSGTQFLSENASGVPGWSSSSGSTVLSAILAASGSNTIANGNNPQTWNWAETTNSQSAMTFGETSASTGTGDIIVNIKTVNASTAIPWQVTSQSTSNGWNISTVGLLEPIGTGALATGGTAHGFTLSEGSTTPIASLVCGTNTVPLGGGASADPTCGTVPNAALTNSSVTFNSVTVALGSSGNITLELISNPTASKTFTFPASGVLSIQGTAPSSSGGVGTTAGTLFSVGAVTGGATTGSSTTAGNGSSVSFSTGDGGSGSGGTNANGGSGGNYTLTIGSGGAKSGTGTAGSQGTINFQQDITTAIANGPAINIIGEYQNASTPTFAADTWTLQDVIGTGTNGTSTLTFSHSGSSGAATILVPDLTDSNLTSGNCVQASTGGRLITVSGACAAGGSGTVSGGVSGDLGSFTSATAISDSGIVATTVVTAASNYTNGDLVQAAGANKTTSDSGVVAANVVTASSNYTNNDLVQAAGNNKTTSDSGIAVGNVVTASANFVNGNLVEGAGANKTAADTGIAAANVPTAASNAAAANQMWVSGGANKTLVAQDQFDVKNVPAANCNNTTAGASWSIGSGGTVTCRAGTNNLGGFISITDTSSTFATFQLAIPEDWDTGTNPWIRFQIASTDATNAHTIIPSIQVACYKGDGSTTDDVAANAAHSLSTITLNGNANRFWSTSNVQMNSTDVTGCVAGALMQITVGRATDTATNAEFYSATITFPRLPVGQAN